ncbi:MULTISPECIES: hypothetical protein [unclassified Microcoleus]|uniref:hypothetical protein n=1 Tax=unclassified Microcoleus TaxID=2642155 RepID=UPI002FD2A6AE
MPVPQDENSSLVEGNRQDACSTRREFISCGREQARCLFHKNKIHLFVEGNRQDACSTRREFIFLWKGTGKMPVPQKENSSFVEGNRQDACSTRREFIFCGREQARCLFHKNKIHLLWNGHLARS